MDTALCSQKFEVSLKQVFLFCVTCNGLLPVKRVLVDTLVLVGKKTNNITVNIFIIIEDN